MIWTILADNWSVVYLFKIHLRIHIYIFGYIYLSWFLTGTLLLEWWWGTGRFEGSKNRNHIQVEQICLDLNSKLFHDAALPKPIISIGFNIRNAKQFFGLGRFHEGQWNSAHDYLQPGIIPDQFFSGLTGRSSSDYSQGLEINLYHRCLICFLWDNWLQLGNHSWIETRMIDH